MRFSKSLTDRTAQQSHRWRCLPGLRARLGFDGYIPESPARGGDTSVFSLPSESADTTPNTSNVSLTTTITSALSSVHNMRQTGRQQEGARLRRTLEAVTTLIAMLSSASLKLIEFPGFSDVSVRAAEEIKRIYLHLLSIHSDDIKALIDSFHLDMPQVHLARIVSDDREDITRTVRKSAGVSACMMSCFGPPIPLVRSSGPVLKTVAQEIVARSKGITVGEPFVNLAGNGIEDQRVSLFSPNTADMNSIENSNPDYDDDLRRTAGSYDREEEENEREGAPGMQRVPEGKKNTGHWRRIHTRKIKTSE